MSTAELTSLALENQFGLADRVIDKEALANSVRRFREQGIVLPTFAQLADPSSIDGDVVRGVDKNAPDPKNLWRVHWYNDLAGTRVDVPDHVVLPKSLTGVDSPIIVVFGDRFPMITAHKVLAAYACLAPRVVTGQFDPTRHRAIWPSTGNYARGGIAISRIMASRGVAILPAGAVRGNDSGAVSIPLAGVQARREIGMSWRLSTPLTPAAERFRTFVRSRAATSS